MVLLILCSFSSVAVAEELCDKLNRLIVRAEKMVAMEDQRDEGKTVHHGNYEELKIGNWHSVILINLQIMHINGCKYEDIFLPDLYMVPAIKCRTEELTKEVTGKMPNPEKCDMDKWVRDDKK